MRDTFVRTLIDIAKADRNVILVTGDLGFGVLRPFWEQLPDQFVNAGIAEQNMTSMAAGLALEGKIVFTYSIGNFPTLRCLEQIRNDCAYHGCNVNIVCVGGGFAYGSLGMSHHATEDIAIMRSLPDLVVMAPGDPVEAAEATRSIYRHPGTCYLRLGRGGERQVHECLDDFKIGKAIQVKEGADAAIFVTGAILDEAVKAIDILSEHEKHLALYTFPTVKPIGEEAILDAAKRFDAIITVEEHNVVGGFGSAVAETLGTLPFRKAKLVRLGIGDCYTGLVGSQEYLRRHYGLTAEGIFESVMKVNFRDI